MKAADNDNRAMDRAIEEFRGFTYCLPGANEKGIIYGIGAWKIGDITKSQVMEQAYEMGKSI